MKKLRTLRLGKKKSSYKKKMSVPVLRIHPLALSLTPIPIIRTVNHLSQSATLFLMSKDYFPYSTTGIAPGWKYLFQTIDLFPSLHFWGETLSREQIP